jgi:hypothetical protein
MDILQRLQPLDVLFAILWAAIVGWGLQTGLIRQIGMLIGVYGAAVLAGSVYHGVGQAMAMAFGQGILPVLELIGYVAAFVVTFVLIGLLIWRAYPLARLGKRQFGAENLLGALVGAVWGVLLLIVLLTIMRFYAVVPWRDQESTQRSVLAQVQTSQVAPVLEVVTAPLWAALAPWFPSPVNPHL